MSENMLATYNPDQVNLLMPTQQIQQVSPWHAARVSEVRINSEPDKGDVYKVGSRKIKGTRDQWEDLYALSKPALMRIAQAAGIGWNWRDSGLLTATPELVIYRAVGAIRLPDGSWQPIMATKEIDIRVIEAEVRERKTADNAKKDANKRLAPQALEQAIQSEVLQWRKNKVMRSETGAMLRVIRAALGMRSQYTVDELAKPFVVPRIDFNPDYSDPEVRHALLQHGAQAMAGLYGQATPAAPSFDMPGAGEQKVHPAIMAGDDELAPQPQDGAIVVGGDSTGQDGPADDGGAGEPLPWEGGGEDSSSACADCGNPIEDATVTDGGKQTTWDAMRVAEFTQQRYGRQLGIACGCAQKAEAARRAARGGGGQS